MHIGHANKVTRATRFPSRLALCLLLGGCGDSGDDAGGDGATNGEPSDGSDGGGTTGGDSSSDDGGDSGTGSGTGTESGTDSGTSAGTGSGDVVCESVVVPYAETAGTASQVFSVEVDGQDVFVADHTTQAYTGPTNHFSYAHFAFAGPVEVEVTMTGDVSGYRVSPVSLELPVTQVGNTFTFTLDRPRKLLLWNPADRMAQKVALFADPLEDDAPDPNDPNVVNIADHGNSLQQGVDAAAAVQNGVLYIPAGTYSGQATLEDDVDVYLAPGAVIDGGFEGEQIDDVKIFGRGAFILDGGESVHLEDACTNIVLQGFVTMDGGHPVLHDSRDVVLYNLKSTRLSERAQTFDGNGVSNLLIDNVFFWSSDDATAIGYRHNQDHVTVRNSVLGIWGSGTTMKVAASWRPGQAEPLYDRIGDFTYENLDCLTADRIAQVRQDCGGDVEDFYFKNTRFEDDWAPGKVMGILYANFDAERAAQGYGNVRNIYLSNVELMPDGYIELRGLDDGHKVQNVTFENVTVGGTLIENTSQPELVLNDHVENVAIDNSEEPVVVTVDATELCTAEGHAPGEFTITRTGPTTTPLTVPIALRGTAENGTDYQAIPQTSVTIPAGQSATTIPVVPLSDGQSEGIETVHLMLGNESLSTDWSVGTGFHAVVTIQDG